MKARIALYAWMRWPDWAPEPRLESSASHEDFIRVTEFVDVEFPELSHEQTVGHKLKALEKERESIVAEFGARLKKIEDQMAQLRALPAPGTVAAPSAPSSAATAEEHAADMPF